VLKSRSIKVDLIESLLMSKALSASRYASSCWFN